MKSGDISQEEIMKEASEMIGKMKDIGGDGTDMNDMLKNLMKNMGGLGGLGGMMGGGKTKFNTAAMGQMSKRQAQVEKMRQRMLAKQKAAAEAAAGSHTGVLSAASGGPASTPLPNGYLDSNVKFVLEPTGNGTGNMSFKLPGEDGIQEKTRINHVGQSSVGAASVGTSASPEELDISWADETVSSEAATKTKKPKSKKPKGKK
jgi:hypothetical protein